jgi:glucosamine-phosphate N-acetyltransferase
MLQEARADASFLKGASQTIRLLCKLEAWHDSEKQPSLLHKAVALVGAGALVAGTAFATRRLFSSTNNTNNNNNNNNNNGEFTLPLRLRMRRLQQADYNKQYKTLLAQLSQVGALTELDFQRRLGVLQRDAGTHIVVVEDTQRGCVVASATVVVEPKFVHGASSVAHVEDVIVERGLRRHGVGRRLVQRLTDVAVAAGCYKLLVNCAPHNQLFYERCGLVVKGVQMVVYRDGGGVGGDGGGGGSLLGSDADNDDDDVDDDVTPDGGGKSAAVTLLSSRSPSSPSASSSDSLVFVGSPSPSPSPSSMSTSSLSSLTSSSLSSPGRSLRRSVKRARRCLDAANRRHAAAHAAARLLRADDDVAGACRWCECSCDVHLCSLLCSSLGGASAHL